MEEILNQENPTAGFSEVEYGLECASNLVLCLSIAANSEEIGEAGGASVLADALHILHEYLSELHNMQENDIDHALKEKALRTEEL